MSTPLVRALHHSCVSCICIMYAYIILAEGFAKARHRAPALSKKLSDVELKYEGTPHAGDWAFARNSNDDRIVCINLDTERKSSDDFAEQACSYIYDHEANSKFSSNSHTDSGRMKRGAVRVDCTSIQRNAVRVRTVRRSPT